MKWLSFILLLFLSTTEIDDPLRDTVMQKSPSSVKTNLAFVDDLFAPKMVREFYFKRAWKPAWTNNGKLTLHARTLIKILRESFYYGLIPNEYHLPLIDSLIGEDAEAGAEIQLDVHLTDALFKYLKHLQQGRLQPHSALLRGTDRTVDSILITSIEQAIFTGRISYLTNKFDLHEPEYIELRRLLAKNLDTYQKYRDSHEDHQSRYDELTTIALNMERWRWEGRKNNVRYLLVNIPAFKFLLMQDGTALLESRVIVGRVDRQTPELTSAVECIVVNPYWNVPRSIATHELLPIIQSDSNYLERNRFDVLDVKGNLIDPAVVDWRSYSPNYFPVRLRQRKGENNALGVIKFQFENKYGVYLHDTDARHLFKKQVRAFSHGCIRAEKSLELAHYLLKYDSGIFTPAMLDVMISRGQGHEIPLRKKLPIYVRYFTADSGGIYNDIYRLDSELMEAFKEFRQAVEAGKQPHLQNYARR